LICLFKHEDTEKYLKFESDKLISHPYFVDADIVKGEHSIYVFDMQAHSKDWDAFLTGRYSSFSEDLKDAVRKYYGITSPEYAYMDSFMYPERYFEVYGKLLDEDVELLKSVGELCNPYDPVKEKLLFSTNKFDIVDKRVSFVE